MRKRSARKWLHFILDLLPVIFIPVFMVYSHRHIIDSYTVEQEEVKVVDFNQLVYHGDEAKSITFSADTGEVAYSTHYIANDNQTCILKCSFVLSAEAYLGIGITDNTTITLIKDAIYNTGTYFYRFTLDSTVQDRTYVFLRNLNTVNYGVVADTINFELFNLTQMFGSGNEPTIEQFNAWYTADYYDFTTGRKEALYTGNTITYNETDIVSQLMYSMYNATDNYFNFNKLFNMQSIYDWVQVNFFNGTAPLVIPIVWNVIVYELFMDILFLIYAVFMFIVDFATNMVDSFLHKSSKGGY